MTGTTEGETDKTLHQRVLEIVQRTNGSKGEPCDRCGKPKTVDIDTMLTTYASHYDGTDETQLDSPVWTCVSCHEKARKFAESQKARKEKTIQKVRVTGFTQAKKVLVYHFLQKAQSEVGKFGMDRLNEREVYQAVMESLAEIWGIDPDKVFEEVKTYLETKMNVSL